MSGRSSRRSLSSNLLFVLVLALAGIYYFFSRSGGTGNNPGQPGTTQPGITQPAGQTTVPPGMTQVSGVTPLAPGGSQPATGNLPSWLTVYFTNPNPPDQTNNGVDQHIIPLLASATQSIDLTAI